MMILIPVSNIPTMVGIWEGWDFDDGNMMMRMKMLKMIMMLILRTVIMNTSCM